MLKPGHIHPEIMNALFLCGHGDKISITDGDYPLSAKSGDTVKVYLGLVEGIPIVTDVLRALLDYTSVEETKTTLLDDEEPEILGEFRTLLNSMELGDVDRFGFYDACEQPCVHPVISTGEKRTFANILIAVGVA